MYDRNTDTLWHHLWGTPAFGRLVGSGITLERLPVTLTTWEAWYAEHPDTQVMDFDTGFVRDYGVGVAYADYFASPDTMFPVWRRSQTLPSSGGATGRAALGLLSVQITFKSPVNNLLMTVNTFFLF